jgi:hypothetical protein
MLKNNQLASKVNAEIRDICRRLDESAALVRKESPSEAAKYAMAVGIIFETISAEIFDPLYTEHPEIAPLGWKHSKG